MTESTVVTGQLGLKDSVTAFPRGRNLRRFFSHWAVSVVLAGLWGKFALNAYSRWAETGSIILLGLVVYNTILVTTTIARRPSLSTSTQIRDWVAALLTVAISLLFRPDGWHHPLAQAVGSVLQGVGLVVMALALMSLGRSFGVVAANRGIKRCGLYGWTRHPLYGSEMIFFTGFLLANFSPPNLLIWLGVMYGLVLRSWYEEDHLSQDPEYRAYMQAVRYSFFPGLL